MKTPDLLCFAWKNRTPAASRRLGLFVTLNRRPVVSLIVWAFFLLIIGAPVLQARANSSVDGVTIQDGKEYYLQNGQMEPLTNKLTLPFDVEVDTNATFKVGKDGKDRSLSEGQVIRSDGWLTSPDGSAEPVYDHIAVKAGKVYVVRDGQARVLAQPMTCTNNLHISPDRSCTYPDGTNRRLSDGQLFQMDGTPISPEDTISLINGQVVVQKSGTLVHLQPVQIMGMADGSKVYGIGFVEKRDGTRIKLQEGQTILVNGIRVGH